MVPYLLNCPLLLVSWQGQALVSLHKLTKAEGLQILGSVGLRPAAPYGENGVPVYCVLPGIGCQGALKAAPHSSARYFFWTGKSTARSATGKWQRRLQRLFELAKMPAGHAHRLRDTFAADCLNAKQVAALRRLMTPATNSKVLYTYPYIPGTETQWAGWNYFGAPRAGYTPRIANLEVPVEHEKYLADEKGRGNGGALKYDFDRGPATLRRLI
jgi:hypothetical protein